VIYPNVFKNGNVLPIFVREIFPIGKLRENGNRNFYFNFTVAVYSNSPLKLRGQSVERDLRTGDSCTTTVI
jgi:hypothetical protein